MNTYAVLVPYDYKDKETREIKTGFTEVGGAWEKSTGNISIQINEGLSVSGNLILKARTEKDG